MLRRFSILASLLLVLLLAPSHSLSGEQSGRKQDWDKILASYSELCNECIELKLRSEAGEKLSQRSVSKLFARLEELRDNLSGAESQMSEEQRRRFESIKRRYLRLFLLPWQRARKRPLPVVLLKVRGARLRINRIGRAGLLLTRELWEKVCTLA